MDSLFLIPLTFFLITFLVTLIEFLTGAERQGLKFFIFFFIFLLIISLFFSLKSAQVIVQKFTEAFASLLRNFKEIKI